MKAKTYSKAEQLFIEQLTRKYLTSWATTALSDPDSCFVQDIKVSAPVAPCLDFALAKKWVSVQEARPDGINRYKMLATGYGIATSFLKR